MTETRNPLEVYEQGREYYRKMLAGKEREDLVVEIVPVLQMSEQEQIDFFQGYFDEDMDTFLHNLKRTLTQLSPARRCAAEDFLNDMLIVYLRGENKNDG